MRIRVKRVEDLVVLQIKDDPQRCGKRDLQIVLNKEQVKDLLAQLTVVAAA